MDETLSKVLIVDDEPAIRVSLRTILEGTGFMVFEAARGEEALALVRSVPFDVVLLDINMPGLGGVDVCRALRRISPALPILMLTVHDSEESKVEALESGADDYVTKPFQLRELIARMHAVMRRNRSNDESNAELAIGDVVLDKERHLVMKAGRAVHLTPKQFDMLLFLMSNAGRTVPHSQLLRSVWGPEYGSELEYLRTFVRQVRMKIEDDPANPRYLLTEPYVGYRFIEPGQANLTSTEHGSEQQRLAASSRYREAIRGRS